MNSIFIFTRALLLHAFTACVGATTLWMAFAGNWPMVIICGIITLAIFGYHSYQPVPAKQDDSLRLNNNRLREVMEATHKPEHYTAGKSFHMNSIQWFITSSHPDWIECECHSPGMPRLIVQFALPSLMPYGGEQYTRNESNLRRLYALQSSNEKERASIKKAAVEVSNTFKDAVVDNCIQCGAGNKTKCVESICPLNLNVEQDANNAHA